MRKLQVGDTIRAQVSGFCGGPVSYRTVTVTKVSENGATWWGSTAPGNVVISGSTGDCELMKKVG
jgi:hypothetical protein